jgi:phospholipid/cholesterol/gamma-HCH transport system permease protein
MLQEKDQPTQQSAQAVLKDGARPRLVLSGSWSVGRLVRIEAHLAKAMPERARVTRTPLDLDMAGLSDLDTAGAWRILRLMDELRALGYDVAVAGALEKHRIFLSEINARKAGPVPEQPRPSSVLLALKSLVGFITELVRDVADLTSLLGATTLGIGRAILQPWRFRWVPLVHHLEHVGLRAIPIITLICFFIGAVLMQQSIVQLRQFGAETFSINMLGILTLREVGVLLVSIMVAGRSASAFTAEIGTMKMREEVDAMRTMGIDPLQTLVIPRVLALLIALPMLTLWGNMMCLAGGAMMAWVYLGYDTSVFLQQLNDAISMRHFVVGMVKAPFAALIIGLVGCLEGLRVRGSAESLGFQVTRAVVKAIFLVIMLDALFAIFLSAAGF